MGLGSPGPHHSGGAPSPTAATSTDQVGNVSAQVVSSRASRGRAARRVLAQRCVDVAVVIVVVATGSTSSSSIPVSTVLARPALWGVCEKRSGLRIRKPDRLPLFYLAGASLDCSRFDDEDSGNVAQGSGKLFKTLNDNKKTKNNIVVDPL